MQPTSEVLRASGLRVTAQRQAVLTVLTGQAHVTAAQIAAGLVQETAPAVSRQGLYNILDDLTRVGLVRCIEPAGSAARYELRVGDNHHHLVCRSCGQVQDVDCAVGAAPCLSPSSFGGFAADEAEVTWWGLCTACQPAPPPTHSAANFLRLTTTDPEK